jgi:hypothetical protein
MSKVAAYMHTVQHLCISHCYIAYHEADKSVGHDD